MKINCERCAKEEPQATFAEDHRYSVIGWFLLLVGVTAIPKRIIISCNRCQQQLADFTDSRDIERYQKNKS